MAYPEDRCAFRRSTANAYFFSDTMVQRLEQLGVDRPEIESLLAPKILAFAICREGNSTTR
jgi:hypothetical protein